MKRGLLASCMASSALACPAASLAHERFRAEAQIDYVRGDGDSTSAVNTKHTGVSGTYYFHALPLSPSDYPFDQVPFVERASEFNASYHRSKSELDNFDTLGNGSSWGVGFVFRRPDTPLSVAARYGASESGKFRSRVASSEFETDSKSYALSAGAYVAKNTLVALAWSESTLRTKNTTIVGTSEPRSTDTTIGVVAQHLAYLAGGTHLALGASLNQTKDQTDGSPTEKNEAVSLAGTYYPTRRLGLTLGYAHNRGDDRFAEGQTFLVGPKYFITPAFSVFANLQTFQAKATNADFDALSLGAALRF